MTEKTVQIDVTEGPGIKWQVRVSASCWERFEAAARLIDHGSRERAFCRGFELLVELLEEEASRNERQGSEPDAAATKEMDDLPG